MADLLGSLLTLAATDAGSFRICRRETDMDTLLIETWEAFLPAFRKKGIPLEHSPAGTGNGYLNGFSAAMPPAPTGIISAWA